MKTSTTKILFFLLLITNCIQGQPIIAVVRDSVLAPAVYTYSPLEILFYIHPGERFLYDTIIFGSPDFPLVTMADGRAGYIPGIAVQRAPDTALFKITYSKTLFPFYSDTSNYACARTLDCGWGGMIWWMNACKVSYPSDTFSVQYWTRRAFEGDTLAMKTIFQTSFGDVDALGQYNFNKWKIINSWSDSALALFLLGQWKQTGYSIGEYLMGDIRTPFGEYDTIGLREYYRQFYPICYEMLLMSDTNLGPPTIQQERKMLKRIAKTQN